MGILNYIAYVILFVTDKVFIFILLYINKISDFRLQNIKNVFGFLEILITSEMTFWNTLEDVCSAQMKCQVLYSFNSVVNS